jgi:hypothetical protein
VDAPETVADAVRLLQASGYTDDLDLTATGVHCERCDREHEPERLLVTHTYRFEGPSDPADEAIVLGVQCTTCGGRAVIVSAYGPEADPRLFEMLARLSGERAEGRGSRGVERP